MPVEVIDFKDRASDYPEALSTYNDGQRPVWRALLYPHRSMPAQGFVWFIGITASLFALPLLALVGSPVLWGLLPFLVLTVAGTWYFLMRSYKDGHIIEEITLWEDHITLVHINPRGRERRLDWSANPYWVQIQKHDEPVENYLTLKGGTRDVQLGTFLSPPERLDLKALIENEIRNLKP